MRITISPGCIRNLTGTASHKSGKIPKGSACARARSLSAQHQLVGARRLARPDLVCGPLRPLVHLNIESANFASF